MTDALFLLDRLDDAAWSAGARIELRGEEGRHAAVVRRIQVGESVLLGDGSGRGVRGTVIEVAKAGLDIEVCEVLTATAPARRYVAAQALAKGDRSELAIEMLTEVGVTEILPWQASRSIVRWSGERGAKSLARWRSTVREAAKQSRRLRMPRVSEPVTTRQLAEAVGAADLALILHEEASESLAAVDLPAAGTVLVVIGPEGGIAPEELSVLTAAGGRAVSVSDGVLRTSTAGVVAVSALMLRSGALR